MRNKGIDEEIAKLLREQGFPYTAEYILKFGYNDMNPNFWGRPNKTTEAFYKKCVEENHPWDYYTDPPGKDIIL